MSRQPKDENNNPIPILPFKAGGGQSVAIGAGSLRSTAVTTQAVTLHATANCFVEIGSIGSMVLRIMDLHGSGIEVGFQCVVVVT